MKTRFRRQAKNAAQLIMLFALSNPWMALHLLRMQERCACNVEDGCREMLTAAKNTEMRR